MIHHPFTVLNPMGLETPSVLTVVDIQHEFFPEFFSPKILHWRRVAYRRSVAEAVVIIAISEYVKGTLVENMLPIRRRSRSSTSGSAGSSVPWRTRRSFGEFQGGTGSDARSCITRQPRGPIRITGGFLNP